MPTSHDTTTPMQFFRRRELESVFGALELRVLDALWRCDAAHSVRDLQAQFPGVAYTTLMTTLDRLHRKGVLDREKAGRAFVYRPRFTREVLRAQLANQALDAVVEERATDLRPILSFFVETVSRHDRESLDTLERLIAERRRALRDQEDGK